jgi:hypothetical protein
MASKPLVGDGQTGISELHHGHPLGMRPNYCYGGQLPSDVTGAMVCVLAGRRKKA